MFKTETLSLFEVKEILRTIDSDAHDLRVSADTNAEKVMAWRDEARQIVEHHLGASVWSEIVRNLQGINEQTNKGQFGFYLVAVGTAIKERAEALQEGHFNSAAWS